MLTIQKNKQNFLALPIGKNKNMAARQRDSNFTVIGLQILKKMLKEMSNNLQLTQF